MLSQNRGDIAVSRKLNKFLKGIGRKMVKMKIYHPQSKTYTSFGVNGLKTKLK